MSANDICAYDLSKPDKSGLKVVHTYGINLEAPVHLVHECGDYMVWHVASSTVWTGVGQVGTKPSAYMLMKKVKARGYRRGLLGCVKIDEIEPGKYWRNVKAAFIQKCNELGKKGKGK